MPQKFFSSLSVLAAGLVLGGCATMNAEECRRANWIEVGQRDGLEGQPMSLLDERIADCKKVGVMADTGRYVTGREQGLQTFCRLENAIPLGLSGRSYEGVCPPMIDAQFKPRFEAGHAVYQLRSELARLEERTESLERQLRGSDRDEEKRLRETEKEDDRKRVRKEFDERRHRLRDELNDNDRRLRRTRDELRAAEFLLTTLR